MSWRPCATASSGSRGTPLITATPGDLGWVEAPDGAVTLIAGYPFCTQDEEWGP